MFTVAALIPDSKPLYYRDDGKPVKQLARANAIQARSVDKAIESFKTILTGKVTIQVIDGNGDVHKEVELTCKAPEKASRLPRGEGKAQRIATLEALVERLNERATYHTDRATHFTERSEKTQAKIASLKGE